MANLTQEQAQILIASGTWRLYVAGLLEEFTKVEERYDYTGDHKDQGMKQGLRLAIEWPYRAAGQESPLTRKSADMLRLLAPLLQERPPPVDASEDVWLDVPARSSGLV